MANNLKPILIADDDKDDVFILRKTLDRVRIPNPSIVVRNGSEAIDYLAGAGIFADWDKYPFPVLLLLDIKMPMRDGFDVLSWWKHQPQPSKLPIVMMSGSVLPEDIEKARSLGASAYRVKPLDSSEQIDLAEELRDYWLALSDGKLNSTATRHNFFPPARGSLSRSPL
jgi:CheY-like chemotaxis protein